MLSLLVFTDFLGTLILIICFFALIYAISASLVTDETLFDRTLLPSSNLRKLTYFIEPSQTEEKQSFPTIYDDPEVEVTFVIPAYNEEKRLPNMLNDTLKYLKLRKENDKDSLSKDSG